MNVPYALRRVMHAWELGDIEAFASSFANGFTVSDPFHTLRSDYAALRGHIADVAANWTDRRALFQSCLESEDSVACQVTMSMTRLADGQASGLPVHLKAAVFATLAGDQVASWVEYFDTRAFRAPRDIREVSGERR